MAKGELKFNNYNNNNNNNFLFFIHDLKLNSRRYYYYRFSYQIILYFVLLNYIIESLLYPH